MNRRGFLFGATGLLMAPALVRASSIMPVSAVPELLVPEIDLTAYAGQTGYIWFWQFGDDSGAVTGWRRVGDS